MASIFDGIDTAAAVVLLATFAETVTYYPQGGGTRVIEAVVERDAVEEIPGGHTSRAMMLITNDDTLGITSAELDRGGDRIGYPVNIGEDAKIRPIKQMPSQTAGMIIVEGL